MYYLGFNLSPQFFRFWPPDCELFLEPCIVLLAPIPFLSRNFYRCKADKMGSLISDFWGRAAIHNLWQLDGICSSWLLCMDCCVLIRLSFFLEVIFSLVLLSSSDSWGDVRWLRCSCKDHQDQSRKSNRKALWPLVSIVPYVSIYMYGAVERIS